MQAAAGSIGAPDDLWNRKQARREYFLATTFQLQPIVMIVKMPAWFQDKKGSMLRAEGGVSAECLPRTSLSRQDVAWLVLPW
jgi:hypothetical protein